MTYTFWKRGLDRFIATVLLVATFPILAITSFILLLFQGCPLIYRQQRIGRNGTPFTLYKFRTMTDGTPKRLHDRPVAKFPHDPRITPLGRFLRRVALDEIPQLWNILRGEMSLVGPRPLPQDDLTERGWLEDICPQERTRRLEWMSRRHDVLPGLTGRWQITRAAEDDFDNWIVNDLAYVDHFSFVQDLRIVLYTPLAIIRGRQHIGSACQAEPISRQSHEDAV